MLRVYRTPQKYILKKNWSNFYSSYENI